MNALEDVTRMVSAAGVFSANESSDELPTGHVKYLMLPALLGTLCQKLTTGERLDIVKAAQVYLRDFLTRCNQYGLCDVRVPEDAAEEAAALNVATPAARAGIPDLIGMANKRANKIKQYKEQKELEAKLDELREAMGREDAAAAADDGAVRDFYTCAVKTYVNRALEDLDALATETEILANMARDRDRNREHGPETMEQARVRNSKSGKYSHKPLEPVIITKDEFQKKVFGAGYPSLPTMTVKEFTDTRIKDGSWKVEPADGPRFAGRSEVKTAGERSESDKEAEERAIEGDDESYLRRKRAMDEYKDDHPRGWGNRYNRS